MQVKACAKPYMYAVGDHVKRKMSCRRAGLEGVLVRDGWMDMSLTQAYAPRKQPNNASS